MLHFASEMNRCKKKGRDLTQSYDKSPYTNRNVKRANWQHKQRHKKFDYTAVADNKILGARCAKIFIGPLMQKENVVKRWEEVQLNI